MPRIASERGPRTASGPGGRSHARPATGPAPGVLRLGHALGNRGTTALLGGFLQRKIAIGPADDPLEREADRIAADVLAPSPAAASGLEPPPGSGAPRGPGPGTGTARRACGGCSADHPCAECARRDVSEAPTGTVQRSCTSCEEEEDELHRAAEGADSADDASPGEVESHLAAAGPGQPLPPALRGYFEPRFDHDFGAVRLHTGSSADAAARAARARAFTLGNDVVFASGEYAPAGGRGRELIAHELAHVVQQEPGARRRAQRQEAEAPPASPPPEAEPAATQSTAEPATSDEADAETRAPEETEAAEASEAEPRGLIVADDARPGPDQMTRTAFLDELHTAACSAAEAGLAGTERSARGCPWIEHYFRIYRGMSADRIERDLVRYVPAARAARNARDYIAPAAEHIRESVRHWGETGEITGVPEGLPGMGLLGAIGGTLAGLGRLLFKTRSGGAATSAAAPAAVAASLGPGRSLSGASRSRMEGAFGTGLGDVRLHTDPTAARLAGRFDARAFTVGPHVAFGAGEFRPGTLAGDVLLAHEVAHVLQQDGESAASDATAGLEQDADRVAAEAAVGLLGRGRAGKSRGPRRRTALRLQRCSSDSKKVKGRPGMGITSGLAPGIDTQSYSMGEYIRTWERAAGRKMSKEERRRLAAGCVGITRLNLGGPALLSQCYDKFEQAKQWADDLQAVLGERPFIFSKRFWSMGGAFTPDPTTGKVDMSGYTGAMPPGEVNFDYAWFDEVNGTWWHANHCDPVVSGGTCADAYHSWERMEVYQSTLEHYSDPNYFGADVQVFCVAWSALT